jgi:hypothetical protein
MLMNVFFWFLLVVFISWVLVSYIIPLLLRHYLKKLSGKFEKRADQASRSKKDEGSVNIDYVPENQKEKEAPGDYVDFEEIDEK